MKKGVIIGGVVVLAAGGMLLLGGEEKKIIVEAIDDPVGDLRLVMVETTSLSAHEETAKLAAEMAGTTYEEPCRNKEQVDKYTLCTTDKADVDDIQSVKESIDSKLLSKQVLCKGGVIYLKQDERVPDGCQVTAEKLITADSRGFKTDLEIELQKKCGWEIYPMDWGCCPHCAAWSEGCPPCRYLCRYANKWKGHEKECD